MTEKPPDAALVEALYQRVKHGMDERIANPKCKTISYLFTREYEWETINAVVERLGEHYSMRGYMYRLDTRPCHAGARAKICLTQDPFWA